MRGRVTNISGNRYGRLFVTEFVGVGKKGAL